MLLHGVRFLLFFLSLAVFTFKADEVTNKVKQKIKINKSRNNNDDQLYFTVFYFFKRIIYKITIIYIVRIT
jgi:hypothetical protein